MNVKTLTCRKEQEQMLVLDMHAHLFCLEEENQKRLSYREQLILGSRELNLRKELGIGTFFSCGTPEEWMFLDKLPKTAGKLWKSNQKAGEGCGLLRSFGIHPWYSGRYEPSQDMISLFEACDAVGEIGMDSAWCSVPLKTQRDCFVKQLEIAAQLKKPVILHTKGQEAQIAELAEDFPGKICVHWYSGDEENFERFLEMGCYFTLGPDVRWYAEKSGVSEKSTEQKYRAGDRASAKLYQRMLRKIPANRIFLETDGIGAVAWAYEAAGSKKVRMPENLTWGLEQFLPGISRLLEENLRFTAAKKQMETWALREQMQRNLEEFLDRKSASNVL